MGLDIQPNFVSDPVFGRRPLIEAVDMTGTFPAADVGSDGDASFQQSVTAIIPDEAVNNIPWSDAFDSRIVDTVNQNQGTVTDTGPSLS